MVRADETRERSSGTRRALRALASSRGSSRAAHARARARALVQALPLLALLSTLFVVRAMRVRAPPERDEVASAGGA
jgi:hypothetical protein